MPEIRVKGSEKAILCENGANLLETLLKEGFFVDNPCNGNGTCGKCKVRILSGDEPGIRLSCLVEVTEDLEVELLGTEKEGKVLTSGYVPEFEKEFRDGYGIAVDIGTTTAALDLVRLSDGEVLGQASMLNAQKQFGQDVLTRITYEYDHPDTGIADLQRAVVESLNEEIRQLCEKTGIEKEEIREIDVAANCTMMHMLLGVDARSIGRAPYRPEFTKAQKLKAAGIGLWAGEETMLYCLPSVSAYIGADIVAGVRVCGLHEETEKVLFIDIGTNGEIVLAGGGHLLSCSCAAGPALEGMNISCGMRAADGAVEDVRITEDGIRLTTIGDGEPEGLCGSGILAAVKELLRTGLIKKTGVFVKKDALDPEDYRYDLIRLNGTKRELILDDERDLFITQGDVRQVQLAKGAILSGFTALLKKAGIEMKELQKVLIAGQFGAHLPAEFLTGVGILPEEVEDRLVYVGNSSKTGAYMTLMSETMKQEMEALAEKIEYMELAETENYERIFTESMIFPGN